MTHSTTAGVFPGAVCPVAPPGAQAYADQITGYVLWGVLILFVVGVVVAIGAVVAGRLFSMPHASKVGVVSIAVVFLAAVGYMILPGMIGGITGSGCV
jgi:threonine/homoserine/homoserine lactone efflux protein